MPHTLSKTVYKFDELDNSAKENARQWFRESSADDNDTSFIYEDAATCGDILGIDLRTRSVKLMGGGTRLEPCIYYSGFSGGTASDRRHSAKNTIRELLPSHCSNKASWALLSFWMHGRECR